MLVLFPTSRSLPMLVLLETLRSFPMLVLLETLRSLPMLVLFPTSRSLPIDKSESMETSPVARMRSLSSESVMMDRSAASDVPKKSSLGSVLALPKVCQLLEFDPPGPRSSSPAMREAESE